MTSFAHPGFKRLVETVSNTISKNAGTYEVHYRTSAGLDESVIVEADDSYKAKITASREHMPVGATVTSVNESDQSASCQTDEPLDEDQKVLAVQQQIAKVSKNGGYSKDKYGTEWDNVARLLLNTGYSDREVAAIMLSKYTRWAADDEGEIGTAKGFGAFMKSNAKLFQPGAVKKLVSQTFNEGKEDEALDEGIGATKYKKFDAEIEIGYYGKGDQMDAASAILLIGGYEIASATMQKSQSGKWSMKGGGKLKDKSFEKLAIQALGSK